MKRRILIVDDDPIMVAFLREGLGSDDWDLDSAYDAMTGFEKARDLRPTVVITDFQMPDFGKGSDLIRALRREPVLAQTPVIIVTSMSLGHVKAQLPKDETRVRFLEKPPDFAVLRRYIKELTGAELTPREPLS
jgi:two-component system cell cycle response regulator DivK